MSGLATGAPNAGGAAPDDFDLFNDFDADDPFATDLPVYRPSSPKSANPNKRSNDALGIDEEIEVNKKVRLPRAKLDEQRLLSAKGIPTLQKRAEKLKLKGKGHEFSDTARLLELYQLWLDDLFPKARFKDALKMVEKLGHKKVIQVARTKWIEANRPKGSWEEMGPEGEMDIFEEPTVPSKPLPQGREPSVFAEARMRAEDRNAGKEKETTPSRDVPDDFDDLFDATPRAERVGKAPPAPTRSLVDRDDFYPDDDDLDALMAEAEMDFHLDEAPAPARQAATASAPATAQSKTAAPAEDGDFPDDLDALLAEAEMEGNASTTANGASIFG